MCIKLCISQRIARHALLPGAVCVLCLLSLLFGVTVNAASIMSAAQRALPSIRIAGQNEATMVAACDFIARDEASLMQAINCVNLASGGSYTIAVMADIVLTQPTAPITNTLMDQLVIAGNDHTIDAQGHGRVLDVQSVKQLVVHDLTLRGGTVISDVNGIEYWGGSLRYY